MISQYKNSSKLLSAKNAVAAERFSFNEQQLFSYVDEQYTTVPELEKASDDIHLELHVYSADKWITGEHDVQQQAQPSSIIDPVTKKTIQLEAPIGINLKNELDKLKIVAGNYKFAINFFHNLIGDYNIQHLRIEEISPDRTEIKLRAIDEKNPEFLKSITNFIDTVKQTSTTYKPFDRYRTYLLNFSQNQTVQFINSVVVGNQLYVKLNDRLSDDIAVNFKCWVVEELKSPYIDNVSIISHTIPKTFKSISGANWQANYSYNTSTESGLKSWTELLGASTSTSQQIIDTYFSGSLSTSDLNLDYSNFNNFIFYSSATERVDNFIYKLNLLEYYTSKSLDIATISGSVAQTNSSEFLKLSTNLVSGFDGFEQYLYYNSSSYTTTTHYIPKESYHVSQLTGSYVLPVPKSNQTVPYTLVGTNSNTFKLWYETLREKSLLYDQLNLNALIYAIPEYVRLDANNVQLETFVNMLAHHYDILYSYINHMSKINSREENPKLGMPNELLYSVAKQFGWSLTAGNQGQDLWSYVLGTNETGTPLTGSNSVGDPAVSGKHTTYAIWRRIVNNLPVLLKSKGTKRSIQALLSCYGIPESLISINEYGGPQIDRTPIYKSLTSNYALDLIANTAGTVTTNYSQSINTVQLRFRTADVTKTPTLPSVMNLFTIGSNTVTLNYVSGTVGQLKINNTGSGNIELFDGGWTSVILKTNNNKLDLVASRAKYGKIITVVSASATASFAGQDTLTLGGTTGGSRLQGQLQELRLWSSSLANSYFANHVKAPSAYNSADPYNDLIYRLPLTSQINHTTFPTSSGIQPKLSVISSSFTGWTKPKPYDSLEEIHYFDAPAIGSSTYDDNKIRLESNNLIGTLDVKTRAEFSQYDTAPLDNNKLGVYFSPQTMVDEDIIAQLSNIDLNQYIGDPDTTISKNSYPDLINYSYTYWQKYKDKTNINMYINMFTLFDMSFFKQLDQLIPARANKLTGVLIQPTLLERSKLDILPGIQRFDNSYTVTIDDDLIDILATDLTVEGTLPLYMTQSWVDETLYAEPILDPTKINSSFQILDADPILDPTKITSSFQILNADPILQPTKITSSFQVLNANSILQPTKITSSFQVLNADSILQPTKITSSFQLINANSILQPTKITSSFQVYESQPVLQITKITSSFQIFDTSLFKVTKNIIGYDDDQCQGYLTSSQSKRYNGTTYKFVNIIYNKLFDKTVPGSTLYITASTPPWRSDSHQLIIDKQHISSNSLVSGSLTKVITTFISGGRSYRLYESASSSNDKSLGIKNHRYNGCKISSTAFNVKSKQTIDGGPVVEYFIVNPNKLQKKLPGKSGNFLDR